MSLFRLAFTDLLYDNIHCFCLRFGDCFAELKADVSDVIFNELAFFRVLENLEHERADAVSATTDADVPTTVHIGAFSDRTDEALTEAANLKSGRRQATIESSSSTTTAVLKETYADDIVCFISR
ncbi:unnamed protein product [Soboliphyme baturini]|uniref:Uncharacterized protein n=1 Tax=Soboliphyme baturini TaxID=241478 RepID=A0A3P8ETK5_9BILA|nr:unnamed protein product [Soboliphyme baturini]